MLAIGSGRGGPAPDFHAVALGRAGAAGLAERLTFELGDGTAATLEPEEAYDARAT